MPNKTTQIPVKKSTRQRLRNISTKGETYDELLKKLINTREKLEREQGFREWFEKNYEVLGFDRIKENRLRGSPDYTMMKNGKEVKVELESLSSNFITHGHDPEETDLVVCIVEDKKLPVETFETYNFEFGKEKPPKTREETGFRRFPILLELAKLSENTNRNEITVKELAEKTNISQQSASRRIFELSKANLIEYKSGNKGLITELTPKGENFLKSVWTELGNIFEELPETIELSGKVTEGMGEGSYYIGQKEYKKQFKEKLGFNPYPGTLDVKLNKKSFQTKKRLENSEGKRINGFSTEERDFGGGKCFPAHIGEIKAGLILPERTIHDDDLIEIIAPIKLRDKLDLANKDEIRLEVET